MEAWLPGPCEKISGGVGGEFVLRKEIMAYRLRRHHQK